VVEAPTKLPTKFGCLARVALPSSARDGKIANPCEPDGRRPVRANIELNQRCFLLVPLEGEVDTKAVRWWAGDNGYDLPSRGRIPANALEAHQAGPAVTRSPPVGGAVHYRRISSEHRRPKAPSSDRHRRSPRP